jgi:hypothetical protein
MRVENTDPSGEDLTRPELGEAHRLHQYLARAATAHGPLPDDRDRISAGRTEYRRTVARGWARSFLSRWAWVGWRRRQCHRRCWGTSGSRFFSMRLAFSTGSSSSSEHQRLGTQGQSRSSQWSADLRGCGPSFRQAPESQDRLCSRPLRRLGDVHPALQAAIAAARQ